MKRSGVADLPLHGGRVPQWLADHHPRSDFKATVAHENAISQELGGRSVFD
jgi:hypothetical protein